MGRPEWMEWDLVFVSHVEERMEERGFTEIDVRTILEEATARLLLPDARADGWFRGSSEGGLGLWLWSRSPKSS